MQIDHIGYAVKRFDRALESFREAGFVFADPIDDRDRNVKLVFGDNGAVRIELVAPLDRAAPSPVDAYLSRTGPTPYHLCYRVASLDAAVQQWRARGARVVVEPAPAIAFQGRRVVFMSDLATGLFEMVQE